jgi:hypothetical protein
MDVSIVIVNYNTRQLTAECLDSVFAKTNGLRFEVILVDNASRDGSAEQFAADPRIVFIAGGGNLGFGRANNRGLQAARGRHILFLNSDTQLINNAVKILADFLDVTPRAGACGGNLLRPDLQPNLSLFRMFPAGGEWDFIFSSVYSRFFLRGNIAYNHTGRPLPVAFVSGADMMVRRAVLEETGGFDEDFFMYFEDAELAWRIRRRGYRIFSVPDARIIHLGGQSNDSRDFFFPAYYQSRRLFLQKTSSPLKAWCLNRALLWRHRFQIATGRAQGHAREWSLNAIAQLEKPG